MSSIRRSSRWTWSEKRSRRLSADEPGARVLVVGTTASILPEEFEGLGATVVQGEAEQLYWRLDEVLARPGEKVQLGVTEDLDRLPPPDWSPLGPQRFRIGYDFWRFPTGLIQSSRGCRFKCNYCPYLVLENATRFRDPRAVAEEMRHGIRRWGFRSFKFRDPLFGLSRARMLELIDEIGRLPRPAGGEPVQFSIESRIELLPPEVLRLLKRAGLTSITFGVETPSDPTLRNYRRLPIDKDRQQAFIATCRALGIRTVAGFMIGFPEDTEYSIRQVLRYALALGPTFANFNVVTPYPGTAFFDADAPSPGHARLQPLQRLYAPVDIRPSHAAAGRGVAGQVFPALLLPLAVPAGERCAALALAAETGVRREAARRGAGDEGGVHSTEYTVPSARCRLPSAPWRSRKY